MMTPMRSALRKAKMESIAEMLMDICEDPTLLDDFRTSRRDEPKSDPLPAHPIPPMPSLPDHPALSFNPNPSFPGFMGGASTFHNMTGFAMPGMTGVGSVKVPEEAGSGLLGGSGAAHMGIGGVMGGTGATFGSMGNAFMRPHPYDCLTPLGPLTDYKEG